MNTGLTLLLHALHEPPEEFSPIPFWFINDELHKEELTRQLIDFKEKGVNGVVVHPRIGIPKSIPYLSDIYFDFIHHIVETAASLNMKIVLYDEAMYPSGTAHGEVVKANPAFASIGLCLMDRDTAAGCNLIYQNPADKGMIGKDMADKNVVGKDVADKIMACRSTAGSTDNHKVIAHFSDGSMLVQKHCGGTIRGIHFGEDDGEPNAPPSADILNPEAVRLFIRLTHDQYYEHLKDYFGSTIIGFFTDEPGVLGRNAQGYAEWTDGLEAEILAAGGDLQELRALFEKKENATTRIYKQVVTKRLCTSYYQQLSDWCTAHGIALMGHPEKSNDIDEETYFHIPGQDLILRRVAPENGGITGMDSVQAKCSADAARHTGKRRNSNECFGVCGHGAWHLPACDTKWMIDWLGVRGVNLFIPHAFYYSLRDARKGERPPDVGPNNIWWKHYRLFSDYIKRLSYLMTDSKNCAQIAVLCESGNMPWEEVAGLYENQIEFNYVPVSLLGDAVIRDGTLNIRDYSYTHYIPCHGTELPLLRADTAKTEDLPRDLKTAAPCKSLRVSHIIRDGIHIYLCVNEGMEAIDLPAGVPVSGTMIHYDLWRDAAYAVGNYESFRLKLLPFESAALIVDETDRFAAPPLPDWKEIDLQELLTEAGQDNAQLCKTYRAQLTLDAPSGDEVLCLEAEEMAECWINGNFSDVSFWNRHRFFAGSLLKPGRNEIEIKVTGSISNRYDKPVPYGIPR